MSKIKERRQRTAETEIDNKATVPDNGDVKTKSYPSKKVLVVLLIIVAIVALFLLIVNAWVDSYASAFAPVDIDNAGATVTLDKLPAERQEYYNTLADKMASKEDLKSGYKAALDNYAVASSNVKFEEGIYNFAFYSINNMVGSYDTVGTIAIISINTNTNKVSYTILDRTTLVYITSTGEGENETLIVGPVFDAYLWGGEALLTRTIQDNYGIKLNGFISVSYSDMAGMIDTFGGVEIANVSAETLEETNAIIAELNKIEEYKGIENVTLDGTKAHLSGMQIVAYVKARENSDSVAMNEIASSFTQSVLSGGLGNIIKLLDSAKGSVNASITRSDFGSLLQHGITNSVAFDKGITTGIDSNKYFVSNVSVCDYTAERTSLVNMIYPAKAEK